MAARKATQRFYLVFQNAKTVVMGNDQSTMSITMQAMEYAALGSPSYIEITVTEGA